ncbi:MAG: hypothetical protein KIS76_03140 [Pyrinomonadaceae bacterium]|nr:hypothetical protein [Pyrinomonadaceae bacterium]
MTIKNFGARVESVWEGLRPMTKKMLVGAMQSNAEKSPAPVQKFSYDTHADWELSRLLSALDEQSGTPDVAGNLEKSNEIKQLAETCADVLRSKTESAEVFIQLMNRALKKADYNMIDKLGDILAARFSVGEIAEIVRQTKVPHICAIAFETLAMKPVKSIMSLLEDPIYAEIARTTLEQQAYDFEIEEAQRILEEFDWDDFDED